MSVSALVVDLRPRARSADTCAPGTVGRSEPLFSLLVASQSSCPTESWQMRWGSTETTIVLGRDVWNENHATRSLVLSFPRTTSQGHGLIARQVFTASPGRYFQTCYILHTSFISPLQPTPIQSFNTSNDLPKKNNQLPSDYDKQSLRALRAACANQPIITSTNIRPYPGRPNPRAKEAGRQGADVQYTEVSLSQKRPRANSKYDRTTIVTQVSFASCATPGLPSCNTR